MDRVKEDVQKQDRSSKRLGNHLDLIYIIQWPIWLVFHFHDNNTAKKRPLAILMAHLRSLYEDWRHWECSSLSLCHCLLSTVITSSVCSCAHTSIAQEWRNRFLCALKAVRWKTKYSDLKELLCHPRNYVYRKTKPWSFYSNFAHVREGFSFFSTHQQ